MAANEEEPVRIKLILLGDSSVGKSSLIRRFVNNNFLTDEPATIGFDFKPCRLTVDGQDVQFNIWDTAGAERYSGFLTPSFYRGAHGALLVYDVTSTKSLNNINYWIDQVEQFAGQSVLKMLVGNKVDLDERSVQKRDGSEFARQAGTLFLETSAKTSENVRDAFIELVRKILQNPDFVVRPLKSGVTLTEPAASAVPSGCSC